MAASEERELTHTELIAEINRVADLILGFGEDIPQLLSELRAMRDSAGRIAAMVAKRFGRSAPGGDYQEIIMEFQASNKAAVNAFNDPTVQDKLAKLENAAAPRDPNTVVAASDVGTGATGPARGAGPERGGLKDLLLFFSQNKELLLLILSLFRQPINPS